MIKVIGVRFKKAGKIYYFSPAEFNIEKGNYVIVETARGIEFGECVVGMKEIKEEEKPADDNNNSEVVKDDKNDDVVNKNPYTNYESLEELKAALPYEFNSYDDLFTEMTDVTYSLIANKEGNPIVHIEAYKETNGTPITFTKML